MRQLDEFEQGVIKAMPMLRSVSYRYTKNVDAAEDLVQETVLRALKGRKLFVSGTNLDAWLVVILRNYFYSSYRTRKREVEDPDEQYAAQLSYYSDPLDRLEAVEMLKLIQRMPDGMRKPLLLIADGASYEEIAEECFEEPGTIKSRLNRGRAILRHGSSEYVK